MKKITLILIVLLIAGNQLFSQVLNCTIFKQGPIPENAITIGNQTLCPGQTATFCTEEVSGATYNWTVTGGPGIQINGSTTGNCVSVTVNAPGTYKLCLSKSVNGYEPCCVCVNIICTPLPCPSLKIVVDGKSNHIGDWNFNCPYDCIRNRLKLDVVCNDANSTPLTNWITTNGISGEIKWEITLGNFNFITTETPCGYNPSCSPTNIICDIRHIGPPAYLVSAYLCPCRNLPFWENISVRATITFRKGGQLVWTGTLIEVIHLEHENIGCGGGGGGGGVEKAKSLVSDIKLFPNPTNEKVSFSFSLAEKAKTEAGLYDIKGNKVLSFSIPPNLDKGHHQFTVKTTHLQDKLYFVVLKINDVIVNRESLIIE